MLASRTAGSPLPRVSPTSQRGGDGPGDLAQQCALRDPGHRAGLAEPRGTIVRRAAASISGLMCTGAAPRRSASASQVSIRGVFVAALSPISQIASACSQSCRSTVPLPGPSADVMATPLASWHMFEQSGRLLVPNSRTHS